MRTITSIKDVDSLKHGEQFIVMLDGDDGTPERYLELESEYNAIDEAVAAKFTPGKKEKPKPGKGNTKPKTNNGKAGRK